MTGRRAWELKRRRSDRVIGGVAGGVADTLGVNEGYVRAAFIVMATAWGVGVMLYLGMWLAALDRVEDTEPELVDTQNAVGLGIAFAGAMILLGIAGLWSSVPVVLTTAALTFGTAFLSDSSKPGPFSELLDPGSESPSRIRLIVGIVLLISGLGVLTSTVGAAFEVGVVFLAVALTGLGILVAFGPWVRRLINDLSQERTERARQEERAEVAAHLHDSVLQTLALIQRSDDPARMAILARHQESELRDWLYGKAPVDGADLVSSALKHAAKRVEADFQIPVDVVTVGDAAVDARTRGLLGAASEALVNAAKHSGAERISLYAEVDEDDLEVYVTDQGKGFDPGAISDDRRGIAQSIRARMEKVEGSVEIDSEIGEGTEVVLRMSL